ncbi:hypothetical protein D3C86_1712590 [compost metagenome]
MHHEVDAKIERPLENGRAPCVVAGHGRTARLGQRHDRDDVRDLQQRVGRRFDPDQAGGRFQGRPQLGEVVHIHEDHVEAPWPEDIPQKLADAHVGVVRSNDPIAWRERLEDGSRRGHAG